MNTLDNDLQSSESLEVGRITRYNWLKTSNWALFLAIVGFVFLVIALLGLSSVVQSFQMLAAMSGDSEALAIFQRYSPYFMAFFLVILGVQLLVNYFQLRFALQLKRSVNLTDQEALESAWLHFRNLFRTVGIMTIVLISFYFFIVFAAMAYAMAMNSQ
ncbi:MAG: hypothetical protein IT260_00720 [Saprospiraceae bacterium]|nr:hypothetical protein [Saprospiraceae bacterium]